MEDIRICLPWPGGANFYSYFSLEGLSDERVFEEVRRRVFTVDHVYRRFVGWHTFWEDAKKYGWEV